MNGFSWARVGSLERSMWRWEMVCVWKILQASITVKYIMKPCHTETVETWVEGGERHESRKTCNRKCSESLQPLVIGLLISLCWSKTLLLERAVCPPRSSGFVISLLLLLLVIMKLRGRLDYLIDLSESKLAKSGVWQVVSLARKWCVCRANIMQELKCREKSGIVSFSSNLS